MRYFDTGVLLKLCLPESRAAEAVALVNASPGKPPVNLLHELEIRSALRQKAGRGKFTQSECDALIAQVESDLATGVHARVTVSWQDVFAHGRSAFRRSRRLNAMPFIGNSARTFQKPEDGR